MPKMLNNELKALIIEKTKEEFSKKSYEDANMRDIAKACHISVGNLYRYYKNKEEINKVIINDVLEEINELVMYESKNTLNLLQPVNNIKFNLKQLRDITDDLSNKLVDIYSKHKIEFNILMFNSNENIHLYNWFTSFIKSLLLCNYDYPALYDKYEILSQTYALSIFEGLKYLFKNNSLNDDDLKKTIIVFLRSYVNMLQFDISNYVGGKI